MDKIRHVIVERIDGCQTIIEPEDELRALNGDHVSVKSLPELLSDSKTVIIQETEICHEPNNEWENATEWRRAEQFIYARAVVSVLVEYKEAQDG